MIIFGGNIIFQAYQASLTSGLSVIKTQKPFDSLDSMLNTQYRLVRFEKMAVLFST